MTWQGKGLTDIGRVRVSNQDAFGLYDQDNLWIVADGMGGHAGGEIASRLAVESVAHYVQRYLNSRPTGSDAIDDHEAMLCEALEAGNQAIQAYAREYPEYTGMGSTAVVLYISGERDSRATIAHAGDSRAYLIRNRSLSLLTRDHSLVEERIELGMMTREQAPTYPFRHVLTRALGIERDLDPSILTVNLTSDDRLLLCTDGLTKMMTDQDISETILNKILSFEETASALVNEANRRGGQDNVTVVVVGKDD